MLLSPEIVEYGVKLNEQPCEICHTSHVPGRHVTLDQVDKNYILKVLETTGGNKTQTAKILGIDRNTLKARLARYC